jgi:hypothetical protein
MTSTRFWAHRFLFDSREEAGGAESGMIEDRIRELQSVDWVGPSAGADRGADRGADIQDLRGASHCGPSASICHL